MTNAQTDAENAGQIIRRRGGEIVEAEGEKSRGGGEHPKKMLKMKIEPTMCMKTKRQTTICPKQKTTFLHNCTTFYTKAQRILQKPSALLSLFERWGTNPSLQNVETRWASAAGPDKPGCGFAALRYSTLF